MPTVPRIDLDELAARFLPLVEREAAAVAKLGDDLENGRPTPLDASNPTGLAATLEALASHVRTELDSIASTRAKTLRAAIERLEPDMETRRALSASPAVLAAWYLPNVRPDGALAMFTRALGGAWLDPIDPAGLRALFRDRGLDFELAQLEAFPELPQAKGRGRARQARVGRLLPGQLTIELGATTPAVHAPLSALDALRCAQALHHRNRATRTPFDLYAVGTGRAPVQAALGLHSPARMLERAAEPRKRRALADPDVGEVLLGPGETTIEALYIRWPGRDEDSGPVQLALPFDGISETGAVAKAIEERYSDGDFALRVLHAVRLITFAQRVPADGHFWLYFDELVDLLWPAGARKRDRDRLLEVLGLLHRAQLHTVERRPNGDRVDVVGSILQLGHVELHRADGELAPVAPPSLGDDPRGFRREAKLHPSLSIGVRGRDGRPGRRFWLQSGALIAPPGSRSIARQRVALLADLTGAWLWSAAHPPGGKRPDPDSIHVTRDTAGLAADLALAHTRPRKRGAVLAEILDAATELGVIGGADLSRANLPRLEGTVTIFPAPAALEALNGNAAHVWIPRRLPETGRDIDALVDEHWRSEPSAPRKSDAVAMLAAWLDVSPRALWGAIGDPDGRITPHLRRAFRRALWRIPSGG